MTKIHPSSVDKVSFMEAFAFWLKLGFISFGGPAGQIAVMHRELVEQKRWISEKRFLHALNYCMLLPGPEAQQLATYIGWLMHRTWGGVVAGALFVLPSLFILITLSWVYVRFGQLPLVAALLYGIKPAVAALVLQAVYRIGSKALKSPRRSPVLWAIALLSFVAIYFGQTPFPVIVICAALLGWLGAKRWPEQFQSGTDHDKASADASTALIDDSTRLQHTLYQPKRLIGVMGTGALLWLAPMAMLIAWQGSAGTLAQMAWFFTKAALLTFGGAYAVLPYVYQGAVTQFAWLTGAQMMDGLALGETTPGPLIMVVTFVGFLGGWGSASAPDHSLLQAIIAACVVTWFTFLPSFIFILAGGPLVESTHGKLNWTSPLTGITAAVVGVIASLALFFLFHVAYPAYPLGVVVDLHGGLDWFGLMLALGAAVGLIYYRLGVMTVIIACAIIGAIWRLVL